MGMSSPNEEHLESEYANFIKQIENLRTDLENRKNKKISIKIILNKLDHILDG